MDTSALGTATVRLPGTCGELVQGTYDGVYCLVSCPIDRFSTATVTLTAGGHESVTAGAEKSAAALRRIISLSGREGVGAALAISSPLLPSRGYGSSTADIGACLYAAAAALSWPLCPLTAARIAVSVEPSDSSILPGLALLDHRRGSRARRLAVAPPVSLLVVDPGYEVDTLAFNAIDHSHELRRLRPVHAEAMAMLLQGLRTGDLEAVGAAATLSAVAHQSILVNPLLDTVTSLSRRVGALGVCRAHSGSILGILLDPSRADHAAALRYVRGHLGSAASVTPARLVDGGPRYVDTASDVVPGDQSATVAPRRHKQ